MQLTFGLISLSNTAYAAVLDDVVAVPDLRPIMEAASDHFRGRAPYRTYRSRVDHHR